MNPRSPTVGGRVAAAESVRYRQFDDELVIVDLEGGEHFALSGIGSRMWHELISGKTPAEVAASSSPSSMRARSAWRLTCGPGGRTWLVGSSW